MPAKAPSDVGRKYFLCISRTLQREAKAHTNNNFIYTSKLYSRGYTFYERIIFLEARLYTLYIIFRNGFET